MKTLILVADYPNLNGGISMYYVHTRSKYYIKNGVDVDVLNFKASKDYIIDGINVITLQTYEKDKREYDLLILHAANLRNHYRFLKKHGENFKKHLFFFHGHEVLKISNVYSKPYEYMGKKNTIKQDLYDDIKLYVWKKYFEKNKEKSYYIFVSGWMKDEFLKNTKVNESIIDGHSYITYNSIGEEFENQSYNRKIEKEYDFITVRGNIDGSKYAIDVVNKLAMNNPKLKFLLIGKGDYFKHNEKASNLIFREEHLDHNQIVKMLDKSKCALMPTRTDAQGLMACEMATFGIPLITSDIPVCHEIFDGFDNVGLIDNNDLNKNSISELYSKIQNNIYHNKNSKFLLQTTCDKELNIIKKVIGE